MAEEEVDVERAFVGFVDYDGVVLAHEGVALDFGEEHAVGHELDPSAFAGLVGEADLGSDFGSEVYAEFFGNAFGNGEGGYSAGLGAGDLAFEAESGVEAHLWNLGGLSGAGFTGKNYNLVRLDCGYNLVVPLRDWEIWRVVDGIEW